MSYDVRLTADLGGPEPIVVGEWNHNYVYQAVWEAANLYLPALDMMTAGEAKGYIREAIETLTRAHQIDAAKPLAELMVLCCKMPRADVRVYT